MDMIYRHSRLLENINNSVNIIFLIKEYIFDNVINSSSNFKKYLSNV